jgi:streptogramin lyase
MIARMAATTRVLVGVAVLVLLSAAPSPGASPPVTNIADAGATSVKESGDWIATGAGGVWLSDPPANAIRRLDPVSGRVLKVVRVPWGPCEAMDVGYGAVWTATCKRSGLTRIEPERNVAKDFVGLQIPASVGEEGSVGAGSGGVWVVVDGPACSACRVARVNPTALRVVAKIPVRDYAAGVRVGYGAVWVTNPQLGLVQKIDPRKNAVVATARVGPGPRFLDVGEGGVWTLNQVDGTVTRVDPRTAKVVARIPAGVVGDGGDLAVGGGWVWARGRDQLLVRIDSRSNRVVERYGPPSGSGSVAVGFGAAWVSAHDVRTVWRLPLPPR